jgi:hypothetical protein
MVCRMAAATPSSETKPKIAASPRPARSCPELMSRKPSGRRPLNTSTWCSRVGSAITSGSGSAIGSRSRISWSSIRQNDTTGAPVRSEPKLGNACA